MPREIAACDVTPIFGDTTLPVDNFITSAVAITDALLLDCGYSHDQMAQIQIYLTAHLMTSRNPQVKSEKALSASVTYNIQSGLGLDSSTFGQMVKIFETKGKLASAGMKRVGLWNL